VSSFVNEIALSGYTNSSQNIISGAHDLSDACFGELVQHPCCAGFQFVFKDDKSDKVQSRFGFCALHLLNLDPVQFGNMFCCTCDDPKATMSIIGKQLFIIAGNCTFVSKRAQFYVGKGWILTAFSFAYILHTLGCAFDVDITAWRPEVSNDDTCPSKLRHELERLQDTEFNR